MTARKARELMPNLHHLKEWKEPDPKRIRHDSIWARALQRWRPGTRVTVIFPEGEK